MISNEIQQKEFSKTIKLVTTQYTPPLRSLIFPSVIGVRNRLATCSGVVWMGSNHIATLNLAGNSLHTYMFNRDDNTLTLMQEIINIRNAVDPADISLSSDNTLLAISNSKDSPEGTINLFAVDPKNYVISLLPVASLKCPKDTNGHGIALNPCSQMFIYTTIDNPGIIQLVKIVTDKSGNIELIPTQEIQNRFAPCKPKGVAFSSDGQFVAVCYGINAGYRTDQAKGFVCIYSFNSDTGLDPDPICISSDKLGLQCAEDVSFFPDSSYIVISDQVADQVVLVSFDKNTGILGNEPIVLKNPEAKLSFPHGNDVSRDGKYLAVANYGDDKITIYDIR